MMDPGIADQLESFWKSFEAVKAQLDEMERNRVPVEAPLSGLLRVQFEIRLKIYHYLIPRKRIVGVSSPCRESTLLYEDAGYTLKSGGTSDSEDVNCHQHNASDVESNPNLESTPDRYGSNENQNNIFLLSKQISGEALDILYGDNIFKVYLHERGEYDFRRNFTEVNRQRIRCLLLIAQPGGVSYMPGKIPDDALWSSIIPNLETLRIVAEQPVHPRSYFGAPTLKEEMDCWVKWIKPFLQCFGQYLSRETIVQVDIGGREETRELLKECLPHGYQEIQCGHVGNLIFKRGRFSLESGIGTT